MSKHRFYYWLFFGLPIIYFLSLPISTGDLAVWIAQGKYLLSHGDFLRHDIYSVLPTKDLIYPAGTCAVYALIYSLGGLVAVSLFHKFVLVVLSMIWRSRSLSKLKSPWSYSSVLIIFLSWFGSSMFWVDRPALIGMVPLLLSYLVLQKEDDLSARDILLLNTINIAWVNFHGSWILLAGMYVWRELFRTLFFHKRFKWQQFAAVLTFLVSSMANPFGYKVFTYIFETASISRERRIDEWAMPSLWGAYPAQAMAYFLLLALALFYCIFLFQKDRNQFKKVLASPFVLLLLLGLQSIRNTALAFFVLLPFACEFILQKGAREEAEEKKSFINLVFAGLVLFLGIAFLPMVKPHVQKFLPENKRAVYDSSAPFAFAQFLNETKDNGPVFNDWEYGSFLILAQKHPIFIDTRNIIYGKKDFLDYVKVATAEEGWERVLEKYKIKYILLNRKIRAHLIEKLNASSEWSGVVMNDETVLYQKKN
ncbi:MAG: hypothetical protein ACXVLQ_07390 [Bacteriovorax sp.]